MISERSGVGVCLCIGGGGGGNRKVQLYVLVGARYGGGWLRAKSEEGGERKAEGAELT